MGVRARRLSWRSGAIAFHYQLDAKGSLADFREKFRSLASHEPDRFLVEDGLDFLCGQAACVASGSRR